MTARHVPPLPPPCLIGLPYDASSSFLRGASDAPPLIRQALRSPAGNDWSERLHDLSDDQVLGDAGDLLLAADGTARDAIEAGIESLLARPARPIALGGDHSVTYPVLRAINRVSCRRPTILHIDAHADLYDDFEGDRYSHACPFARIMEEGLASRLVQVGIRTLTPHLQAQAERFSVEVIDMRAWAAGARPRIDGPVYVSVDLDALDPAFAPGVSHWEPGGLSTRDVVGMIQSLSTAIVGADIVEFNPRRDASGMTATVAAKFVKELASAMQYG
jgi:arginase